MEDRPKAPELNRLLKLFDVFDTTDLSSLGNDQDLMMTAIHFLENAAPQGDRCILCGNMTRRFSMYVCTDEAIGKIPPPNNRKVAIFMMCNNHSKQDRGKDFDRLIESKINKVRGDMSHGEFLTKNY